MKKVIDANIGGMKFSLEEDAHERLQNYLERFASNLENKYDVREVMEDIELRIAELFQKELKYPNQVVTLDLVQEVIQCLGEVEGGAYGAEHNSFQGQASAPKKLYRNTDDKMISGVCSGLGAYVNLDVTVVRVLFLATLLFYGSGVLVYCICWFVFPEARTVSQKMEMMGIPQTAENIKNFNAGKSV